MYLDVDDCNVNSIEVRVRDVIAAVEYLAVTKLALIDYYITSKDDLEIKRRRKLQNITTLFAVISRFWS